jgi:hypothetical protein
MTVDAVNGSASADPTGKDDILPEQKANNYSVSCIYKTIISIFLTNNG